MKNIIFSVLFVLSVEALVSCTKKENVTSSPLVFSLTQFAPKNFLATAD